MHGTTNECAKQPHLRTYGAALPSKRRARAVAAAQAEQAGAVAWPCASTTSAAAAAAGSSL